MSCTIDAAWARRFQIACRHWQKRLGLLDWTITYKTKKGTDEAEVDYDCVTRTATITAFLGAKEAEPPARVALHEMLHLLLADAMRLAALRKDDTHPDVDVEEHRAVERLIHVIYGGL
jgi:hypothetical protein